VLETHSYTVSDVDVVGTSDVELERRLDEYLTDNPFASTNTVLTSVQGSDKRIRQLLKTSLKYDSVEGARGAVLWFMAAEVKPDESDLGENPPK